MSMDWSALGRVAVVSVGATVGIVVVFALGVRALATREPGPDGTSDGQGALALTGLCFAACAAVIGYGLYLIVPQFH
ncbi:hypothetical protein [Streptomyces sp. RKAG293]|uniref:hypothetical protein n=1 Tax=Streptomyces sp. RKAG293 TaxID=2893403 RepID=UPI002033C098|nr:hypothetical protein [Streptomyces sp. RKAG293]MCM2416920.1 hypothetical protein [Streptomyces sp. RKAG293]